MSFAKSMSIKNELQADVNKVARMAAFFIDQRLVLQTPVDTGEARGSWQVSVNKPITSDTETQDKTGSLTLSQSRAIIEASQKITYPTFYIRSNKPYIERLNNGYSAQAPANFADKSITEGLNDVQSITL